MSQYPSMPPPGAYVPPNQSQSTPLQSYGAQHQQQGYQQPQAPAAYQPSAQGHGQPTQSNRASVGTFGQMMNQAVTTGKPMLNKLSKTISSKLGNKQSAPGTPQNHQSYQNSQQHYGQQAHFQGQQQNHTFTPQVQQSQQSSQAPSTYPSHQQANYGSGQGSYFTQQTSAPPHAPYAQAPPTPQQPSPVNYNGAQFGQAGSTIGDQHTQMQYGQHVQEQMVQGQHQHQPLQAQYTGQQTGVIGGSQRLDQSSNPQSPQVPTASPSSPAPPQPQWYSPHTDSEQSLVTTHQQQSSSTAGPAQSYFSSTNSQIRPTHQQWTSSSPVGSGGQTPAHLPPASISPPPTLPVQSKPPIGLDSSQQPQPPTPASHHSITQSGSPKEFIAELPADLGGLSITEAKPLGNAPISLSGQTSPYQAYQASTAPSGSPSPGLTIARRAVSVSNMPYADPWRFANPLTELPTREFYVLADLLFDALDRKFEPQNTGMLEASKILKSWIDLTEDAIQLFSHRSYSAFGKMWSLQGIPHVMAPCQPSLSPIWNFNQHAHAQELKFSSEHTYVATYTTYMPALNRAGWYKFFFLEMMHGPDNINKLMPALCSETYKPGVLHHPDLTKRDKAEAPTLQARASEIQTAVITRVCNETKAAMLAEAGL